MTIEHMKKAAVLGLAISGVCVPAFALESLTGGQSCTSMSPSSGYVACAGEFIGNLPPTQSADAFVSQISSSFSLATTYVGKNQYGVDATSASPDEGPFGGAPAGHVLTLDTPEFGKFVVALRIGGAALGSAFPVGSIFNHPTNSAGASGLFALYEFDGGTAGISSISYDTLGIVPGGTSLDITGAALFTPAAVPEPETYALMLAGLGAVGFVARRRAKRVA